MDEQVLAQQWRITQPDDQTGQAVLPRTHYGLRNLVVERSLRYGERSFGINLEWDRAMRLGNVSFERSSASNDSIRYDEPIAIRIKREQDSAYLRYQKRHTGINLSWSPTAVYEWRLGGGSAGAGVDTSKGVSLYNLVENDYLVYCARPFGINLRWLKDQETQGCRAGFLAVAEALAKGGIDSFD